MNKETREQLERVAQEECELCNLGLPHMTMIAITDPETGKTSLATHCGNMETIIVVGALESAKGYWVNRMNSKATLRDDVNNFRSDLH